MSAEIILDKIEALPALSDSVNHILDICDNPDSALNDLIEAVREDPLVSQYSQSGQCTGIWL